MGDDRACLDAAASIVAARLRPLPLIASATDTPAIKNVRQLALTLVRTVGCAIANHWMRTMPPEQSAGAAAVSDGANCSAFETILRTCDSPTDRADLAMQCASLPTAMGGLGAVLYVPTRAHRFVAKPDNIHHPEPSGWPG